MCHEQAAICLVVEADVVVGVTGSLAAICLAVEADVVVEVTGSLFRARTRILSMT
jgi:TPP-dependent trihydroxycyclohexane-1,2-dione (THcHDO) dehydratase